MVDIAYEADAIRAAIVRLDNTAAAARTVGTDRISATIASATGYPRAQAAVATLGEAIDRHARAIVAGISADGDRLAAVLRRYEAHEAAQAAAGEHLMCRMPKVDR